MAEQNTENQNGNENAGGSGQENEWTPPTREEWEALQKEKATARSEAADRKRKLAELTKQHEDADSKSKREATEAALASIKPVAIRAEAKAAFLAAGADATKVSKLTRWLDLSKIEIDGDDVTGLDDQVAELKQDFPELFGKPANDNEDDGRKPRVPKVNTKPAAPAGDRLLTVGEQVARELLGR